MKIESDKRHIRLLSIISWISLFFMVVHLFLKFSQNTDTAVSDALPILIFATMGFGSMWTFILFFVHPIEVTHEGITVMKLKRRDFIPWEEIEKIKVWDQRNRQTHYSIKPKKGRTFFTYSDRGKSEFMKSLNLKYHPKFETEMGKIIDQKKKELEI